MSWLNFQWFCWIFNTHVEYLILMLNFQHCGCNFNMLFGFDWLILNFSTRLDQTSFFFNVECWIFNICGCVCEFVWLNLGVVGTYWPVQRFYLLFVSWTCTSPFFDRKLFVYVWFLSGLKQHLLFNIFYWFCIGFLLVIQHLIFCVFFGLICVDAVVRAR